MGFQGFFFDGESGARHEVTVTPTAEKLVIHARAGEQLALWPYPALELLEEVYAGHPARLYKKGAAGAVLTINDPAFLDELEHLSGRRFRAVSAWRPSLRLAVVAAGALAVVVGAFFALLPRLVDPLAGLVPLAWEQALGQKVIAHLAPPGTLCGTPAGDAALEALTARLLPGRGGDTRVRVRVADRSQVNAFAAPGGEIVMFQGLLAQAGSAEEVAGVLAHEIAHSLQRHPLKGLLRAVGLRLLFSALVGDATALEGAASDFGQALVGLSYTRENEADADRMGVELLNRADIRGDGLASFFQRLMEAGGGAGPPPLLSSHPATRERLALIRASATGSGPALDPAQWDALKGICGGEQGPGALALRGGAPLYLSNFGVRPRGGGGKMKNRKIERRGVPGNFARVLQQDHRNLPLPAEGFSEGGGFSFLPFSLGA